MTKNRRTKGLAVCRPLVSLYASQGNSSSSAEAGESAKGRIDTSGALYYLFLSPYTYASFRPNPCLGPDFYFHIHLGKLGLRPSFLPYSSVFLSRSDETLPIYARSHCKRFPRLSRDRYMSKLPSYLYLFFLSFDLQTRSKNIESNNFFFGRKKISKVRTFF